ncbi:MAG: NAD(P)/FAD-dependent oxidoreductase [Armatimonadota bacterium]|nr:NAD(P)/FAD-dependent oxidoreductase [Armatimonadota bacterium]MDR7459793.1 NAD(P)/FAD-dependent oxidoreductase [Armatimonadota bacterium]MDR7480276.1 NAD(P)/FAD-dependent oxidoreductase [Armatimonadota bacterium]MDR7488711.1 NAD(P)/FAD-dependent oxidoreductase [Armatimonadota bacterium]MDR7492304.1 NAD(P)/FAD-dependent oxidoreductase [Armatimonadota bacterium]
MAQTRRARGGAHSPLLAALRRAVRLAAASDRPGAPPVDELPELAREGLTRRRFLRSAAATAALLGAGAAAGPLAPALLGAPRRTDVRVVIVGAGIAGLTAAYHLRRAGVQAQVYEAAGRTGGRMFSRRDVLAPGLVTEFGGEFINSDHTDLLALVRAFGLELMDMEGPGEAALRDAYVFDGRHRREAEVIEAFRPLARRIAADADRLPDEIDFRQSRSPEAATAVALDRLSLAEYLGRIGATGWIRELLEVAYVTEFGLDAGEQSALNFIDMIGTDLREGFKIVGDSDERYKVRGGNQQVVDTLARRLAAQVHLSHRLVAVRPRGRGFTLTFERRGAGLVEVRADLAVLAIPFTVLREVDLGVDLPAWKWRTIRELGYGTNAKLMFGLLERPWRRQGYSGAAYSDEGFQLCWDNSRGQPGPVGGVTLFSGGTPGLAVGRGTVEAQEVRLLPGVERVFPGTVRARTGRGARWHWPTYPFTKGSYACWKPGQWTSVRGAERLPVGNLFFAGEHCSLDFQGFMNGGAETGRMAAQAVLRRVGVRP